MAPPTHRLCDQGSCLLGSSGSGPRCSGAHSSLGPFRLVCIRSATNEQRHRATACQRSLLEQLAEPKYCMNLTDYLPPTQDVSGRALLQFANETPTEILNTEALCRQSRMAKNEQCLALTHYLHRCRVNFGSYTLRCARCRPLAPARVLIRVSWHDGRSSQRVTAGPHPILTPMMLDH